MSLKSLFTKLFYNDVIVEVPDAPKSQSSTNIMDETIIISCYFNPMNSPYRLKAFNRFYEGIKKYNHKIVECIIGNGTAQLPDTFEKVHTSSLLWHKETLLNNIIKSLPTKYKYIFWVDADIIFTNPNWVVEGAKVMENGANMIQPFEYCIHLEKDRLSPDFNVNAYRKGCSNPMTRHKSLWRSFCSNYASGLYTNNNYDTHGHVGFAYGIRREIYNKIQGGLYDKALIGGADHIMAHAAAGQINHPCIANSFTDDIDNINEYSRIFYKAIEGKLGYIEGDVYHIWHGELKDRQYLKRVREFSKTSKKLQHRDENGFFIQDDMDDTDYMLQYFMLREVSDDGTYQDNFIEEEVYIDNDTNWINAPVERQDNNSSIMVDDNIYIKQDNSSYNIQDDNNYQGSTFS